MAGAILSSVLTVSGSGYSATPPFNEGFIIQGGNATGRYRTDSIGVAAGIVTYTVINPGSGYTVGGALTSDDFGGFGAEFNILSVSGGGGSGYINRVFGG